MFEKITIGAYVFPSSLQKIEQTNILDTCQMTYKSEPNSSDESEPSWGIFSTARLVAFSPSARNQKSAENEPKFYVAKSLV